MKLLKIPHRLADYLCPINGLCDIYEWKTGNRIPDDLLFFFKSRLWADLPKESDTAQDDLFRTMQHRKKRI